MIRNIFIVGVVFLIVSGANAAVFQSEGFDSAASAAANGWTLVNGSANWGWQGSNFAGGAAGEGHADTFVAGSKRYYADTDLDGALTLYEDWSASGKMDFIAPSRSDGYAFFGFFDKDADFSNNSLAGFLLVNGILTLRFEKRPGTTFIDSADFGLWENDDRTFSITYDADGAGAAGGLLTASLTRVADSSTVTRSIVVSSSLFPVGAGFDSFGFFAQEYGGFNGRYTPFDWVVDDLTYSAKDPHLVSEPASLVLLGLGLAVLGVARRRKAS